MTQEIKMFKLVSGEDVLAEFEGFVNIDNVKHYSLSNPVGVGVIRDQNGQPSVGFGPFPAHAPKIMPSVKMKQLVEIPMSSVVYSYIPDTTYIDNYNQIFGSGIVLPNKQIITG